MLLAFSGLFCSYNDFKDKSKPVDEILRVYCVGDHTHSIVNFE